jgi:sulfur relay (sulfurtransferase) complex TusBCD TusD component (DsrE family)
MESISIVLKRPPYGTVDAAEAIRHALGGITDDMEVRLILVAGGVHAARKGHDASSTEYMSIEDGIRDCIDMGVVVSVEKSSMIEANIAGEDLIEGVDIASGTEIAEFIKQSDTAMIF